MPAVLFTLRETFWGLNHLWLRIMRNVIGKPANLYMNRYVAFQGTASINENGIERCCDVCGFSLVKLTSTAGWELEMCSALPVVDLRDQSFQKWFESLEVSDGERQCVHTQSASVLPGLSK